MKIKTRTRTFLLLFLICILLGACGSPQTAQEVTPTQDVASIAATQTAQVPTATSTSVPTATSPPIPTATLVPTATPNQTATVMAGTQEASLSTQQARQTATAVSAQSTQQAEDDMWAQMVQDGSITYNKGVLYTVDDFEQSWAQRNWYQWWSFGYNLSDFVVMTHIDWQIPEGGTFGTGGCGFAIRIKDNDNHLVLFLTPQSSASLGAMTRSGFRYQSYHWQNPNNPNLSNIAPATTGSADFTVVAEKEFVSAYLNGERIYQWYVALTSPGDMGYTIVSGTNKDFGIDCKFTNTRVWELKK
jgi:hypothetical protein